jgi:hypothetical protein
MFLPPYMPTWKDRNNFQYGKYDTIIINNTLYS